MVVYYHQLEAKKNAFVFDLGLKCCCWNTSFGNLMWFLIALDAAPKKPPAPVNNPIDMDMDVSECKGNGEGRIISLCVQNEDV
jgi:hypothetical protein